MNKRKPDFPTIDKFVLNSISSFDNEERVRTLKLLSLKKNDPIVKLCLAFMFEALNQRHDSYLRLASFSSDIRAIQEEIESIKERLPEEEDGDDDE